MQSGRDSHLAREETVLRVRIGGSGQGESLEDKQNHVGSSVVVPGCSTNLIDVIAGRAK